MSPFLREEAMADAEFGVSLVGAMSQGKQEAWGARGEEQPAEAQAGAQPRRHQDLSRQDLVGLLASKPAQ